MSYFHNIRGANNGTHIPAYIPEAEQARFRNRKGGISQNVLAGCSLDMYFFYVCAGWEESANVCHVLQNAKRHGFPYMEGRLYLADAGYGVREGILTPYRTVRYHLREQALARLRPKTKEELFNLRHVQLRNVVQKIFGVLNQRFHILHTAPRFDFRVQAQLVPALCALHNFVRSRVNGEEDLFYQEADSILEESFQLGKASPYGDERDQLQGTNFSDGKQQANLRDWMAERMWTDYMVYLSREHR